MNIIRLNLGLPSEPRDASLTKDSLVKNAYLEPSKSEVIYIRKRPGFVVGTEGVTTGNSRGIFYHNGIVWVVTEGYGLQGWAPPIGGFGIPFIVVANEDFV